MNSKRNILIAALIILATPLYFALDHYAEEKERLTTMTSYSHNASGLSLFYTLARQNYRADLIKKPLIKWAELSGYKSLMIAAPLFLPTQRQTQILREYVDFGGSLILTFHDEQTASAVSQILSGMLSNHDFETAAIKNFTNRNTRLVKGEALAGDKKMQLFSTLDTYEFYSRLKIVDKNCVQDNLSCYAKIIPVGAGEVIIFSGLPPFGNALIGLSDNRKLAFNLMHTLSPLVLDEYFHGYSDRTLWDLFDLPLFALPLIGMLVLVLLYFMFARNPLSSTQLMSPGKSRSIPSYHRANELIFADFITRKNNYQNAITEQARFLKHFYPQEKDVIDQTIATLLKDKKQISDKKSFLNAAKQLVSLQHAIIKNHGDIL